MKGSAVSAGAAVAGHSGAARAMALGITLGWGQGAAGVTGLRPGVPRKKHRERLREAAMSQGRIWGSPHPKAVALTDTSFLDVPCFQGTALSLHCFCPGGMAIPICGMEQSPFFVLVL